MPESGVELALHVIRLHAALAHGRHCDGVAGQVVHKLVIADATIVVYIACCKHQIQLGVVDWHVPQVERTLDLAS